MKPNNPSKRAAAGAMFLPLALAFLALSASALTVTVTSPTPGTWTGSDTAAVSGTASGPTPDRRVLDTSADFAGGGEVNVTTSSDRISLLTSPTETYRYFEDFTGLALSATIDEHWMWNLTGTFWQVTNLGSLSANPPSLGHSGTTTEHLYFDTLLPGPLVDGRVSFGYYCQANAFLNAWASSDGSPANRTPILSVGASAANTLDYNLTAVFSGASSLYVHFEVGASSPTNSFCAIDDFELLATVDTTAGASRALFADDFTWGANSVWNGYEGYWAAGNASGVSDTPPALYHVATGTTSVWANWGAATPILNASLSFHYQCEANAALQAYLSRDGTTETRILNGVRGAGHTSFSFNATAILSGGTGTFLRFASDATTTPSYFCGVDDIAIAWNVTGYLNLTYSGAYTSPSVDLGFPSTLTTADWVGQAPAQTLLTVSFRSSANNVTFSPWALLPSSGASVAANGARFAQFRVNLTSFGGRNLPSVDRLGLNFSALSQVEVSVNGGPWSPASGTDSWSADVPLAGGSNNITARVTDSTGFTASSVVQVFRDTFPPSAPGKPSGPAVTNLTDATWNWGAAADVGLGVDHYLVDVGITPGGSELGAGMPASGTSYLVTGLPDNVRVYLTAWAVDLAGLVSLSGSSSDATLVDRTAPGPVTVQGPGAFTASSSVTWSWSAGSDAGSGVSAYSVRVGSIAGAADVATATTTFLNFTFPDGLSGSTYFLSVAALDNAGNLGPASAASGVTVDQVAPAGPGSVSVPSTVTNSTSLTWSWPAATDALSGIDHYLVTLGTTPGAADIASLSWTATSYTASYVAAGAHYYFEVRAVDRAGNLGGSAAAQGVLVDVVPPSAPAIDAVAAFVSGLAQTISWNASEDLPAANASGLDHYIVRVAEGENVTTTTASGLEVAVSLVDGAHYRVSVSAVDRAGNEGPSAPVSFTADRSGPAAPAGLRLIVSDAGGPTFQASWNGTVDAGSGVKGYRISIGTTPGGEEVASARVVDGTTEKWTGSYDTVYFVTVWGIDDLGNAGPPSSTTQGVSASRPGSGGGGGFLPGPEAAAALFALAAAAFALGARKRR